MGKWEKHKMLEEKWSKDSSSSSSRSSRSRSSWRCVAVAAAAATVAAAAVSVDFCFVCGGPVSNAGGWFFINETRQLESGGNKTQKRTNFSPVRLSIRPSVRFSSILFLYAAAQTAESVFFFCVPRLKMAAANNNNIWWKHNLKIFGLIKSLLNFLFNLDKTV